MNKKERCRRTNFIDEEAQVFEHYYRVYTVDNGFILTMGDLLAHEQTTFVYEDRESADDNNKKLIKFLGEEVFSLADDVKLKDFKLTIKVEPINDKGKTE